VLVGVCYILPPHCVQERDVSMVKTMNVPGYYFLPRYIHGLLHFALIVSFVYKQ